MGSKAERGNKALAAMKVMGFPSKKTKLIIKNLLRACENNWEHIEAENYRLLIETILDSDEAEEEDQNEKNTKENVDSKKREAPVEALVDEEPELYRKRPKLRHEEQRPSSSVQSEGMPSMKTLKVERGDSSPRQLSPGRNFAALNNLKERNEPSVRTEPTSANTPLRQENIGPPPRHSERQRNEVAVVSSQMGSSNGRPNEHSIAKYQGQPSPEKVQCLRSLKEPIPSSERVQHLRCLKEPKIEPGLDCVSGAVMLMDRDKSVTSELLSFEVPIAIVRPHPPLSTRKEGTCISDITLEYVP